MTEYCSDCKRMPLMYDSEYDSGLCYDCQDRAIAKSERMRDWAEFHDGEIYDEQAEDSIVAGKQRRAA